jgi:hypothetical protein
MSRGGFKSSTKMNYSRGIVPSQTNTTNSNFYGNMYGKPQLLNQINNFLKRFPNRASPVPGPGPKPTPIYNTKIIAILNFNDPVYDQPIVETLKYYFENVPRFYEFPIVDYGGDFDKLLELLNEYYDKGFRYFLTATLTPALSACIQWFAEHPDAQAVSSQTRLLDHKIPKNIYRLPYSDIMPVTEKEIIGNYEAVFYVYASINNTAVGWNDYLQTRCSSLGIPYFSYPVSTLSTITDTNFVNVTMDEIQQYVTDNSYNKISISCTLVEWQNAYYNKFIEGETTKPSNSTFYNVSFSSPKITEIPAINYFINVPLYSQLAGHLNTSPLWRKGLDVLNENYSRSTLNMMEIVYKMELSKGYIFEIGAHSDALLFDLVTRDGVYESYMYELFTPEGYQPRIIYFRSNNDAIFKSEFGN